MKTFNYVEQFGDVVSEMLYIGACKGRTAGGEFIIPCQLRQGDTVVAEGDLLYFRTNSLAEIMLDAAPKDGWAPTSSHKVSQNGIWLSNAKGSGIDTEGYGFSRK